MAQQSGGTAPGKDRSAGKHKEFASKQLDIVAASDTRYPNLRNPRRDLHGNGKTPGNPFARDPHPKVSGRRGRKGER